VKRKGKRTAAEHRGTPSALWCVDDIVQLAQQGGLHLADDQVADVVAAANSRKTYPLGPTWGEVRQLVERAAAEPPKAKRKPRTRAAEPELALGIR
jgi:hypothetical protein